MGEASDKSKGAQRARRNSTGYEPVLDGLWLSGQRLKPGIIMLNYTGRGDDVVATVVDVPRHE